MAGLMGRLFGKGGAEPIPYEKARDLAANDKPSVRRELARRSTTQPEVLYFLASDETVAVRREIAGNNATPRQADLMLAREVDESVRTGLAAKIARLAPTLASAEQDNLRRVTEEVLEVLARDEATRVRQILSEALKDVASAPHAVIKRLARDVELVVAGPVLEHSPVLSDDDLVEIINSDPVRGALSRISRRGGVNERVCDAIAKAGDDRAITELLGNDSAQIREETLDRLIDRAPEVEAWHAPLVRRPYLPARAALRLAQFVADALLNTLTERADLDPEAARAVAEAVGRRIAETGGGPRAGGTKGDGKEGAGKGNGKARGKSGPTPLERAVALHRDGKLDEDEIAEALGRGDRAFVMASLAVRAGVQVAMVEQVVSTHSAKGVVSLAWKADLSIRMATQLQMRVAGISPRKVLPPASGKRYPMSNEDMEWQLEFFRGLGSR